MCVEAFTDYPPLGRFAVRYVLPFPSSPYILTSPPTNALVNIDPS